MVQIYNNNYTKSRVLYKLTNLHYKNNGMLIDVKMTIPLIMEFKTICQYR